MNVINCPRCGKVFRKIYTPVCESCAKALEEEFEIVRNYVKENPGQSLGEVSEVTGVSAKQIHKYLREGRLEATQGMHGDLRCTKCETPILSGRMCEDCAKETTEKVMKMKPLDIKHTGKIFTQRRGHR